MTEEYLRKLLKEGENYTTEFKKCRDEISASVYETVCSFSNRYGGYILLGVDDDGKVTGVNPKAIPNMQRSFATTLNNPQKISPPLLLNLEEFTIDDKTILYVYVPVGSLVETCKGKLFDRTIDADIDITVNTVLARDLYNLKAGIFTERKLFPNVGTDKLKIKELMPQVRLRAQMRNPNHPWLKMSDKEIMRSASLLVEDPKILYCHGFSSISCLQKGLGRGCIIYIILSQSRAKAGR